MYILCTCNHGAGLILHSTEGFVRDLATTTKKCQEKPDIHESTENIEAHRASSKDTRLFLAK